MAQALFTGATGLRAFQRQLEVVANNLANLNTTGFKASRVQFSDLNYTTIREGAGSNSDDFGGINPAQVGAGVRVAQVSRQFSQGVFQDTGETLDFAIRGDGFFVVNDRTGSPLLTRAGSFALDRNNNLVDPSTGFLVRRIGTVGEEVGEEFGFQATGDQRVNIPLGSPIPGVASSTVGFEGNLPATANPPLQEIIETVNPFETDTGPATLTTTFSELTSNVSDYEPLDEIEILGTDVDGTPYEFSLPADTATFGDVVDAINAQLTGAVAELDDRGELRITANQTGDANLTLVIRDSADNANFTIFADHAVALDTEGGSGDVFQTSTQVFDSQGNQRSITFGFRKISTDTWEVTPEFSGDGGSLVDTRTYNVSFNDNGAFSFANASAGSLNLQIQFDGIDNPQVIGLDFDELSHTGSNFGLEQDVDGASAGVLADISVSIDGVVTGIGSNGTELEIAQLALASVANVDGLEALGDNYYQTTTASGTVTIGTAETGGRGGIVSSQLETSNVDITQEFATLIVAQRAFSANARTVTVADEILDELTNLVR